MKGLVFFNTCTRKHISIVVINISIDIYIIAFLILLCCLGTHSNTTRIQRYISYSPPRPRPSSQLPLYLSKSTASSAEPHRTMPVVTVFSDYPENWIVVLSDTLEFIVIEVGVGRSAKTPCSNLSHLHQITMKHHVNRITIDRYIPGECNTGDAGLVVESIHFLVISSFCVRYLITDVLMICAVSAI